MAEIRIKWDKQDGRQYAESCWEGIHDPVAETVCDLLEAVEDSDILEPKELEGFLHEVSRIAMEITLAVRSARRRGDGI